MKKFFLLGMSFILLAIITRTTYGAALEWELVKAHSNIFFGATLEWELEKEYSNIYFGLDHIDSKIQGHFNEFIAKINFDPANLQESRFFFEIKVDSIDTNVSKRDKHLLSADFFDAAKYPLITFESTTITDEGGGVYNVAGRLTIKGKEYDLKLPLTLTGIKNYPVVPGKKVGGFNGKLTLDRLTFNIGDGKFINKGIIGKEVEVFIHLELLSA